MIINIIIPFKRLSGGIKVAFLYANYLVEQGHDVKVYMPMVSYPGKGQSIPFRIKASISNTFKPEHWFDRKFELKTVPLIKPRYIRDADITIATAWQTAYDVKVLPKRCGEKVYLIQGYEIFGGSEEQVDGSYKLGLHSVTITQSLANLLKDKFDVESTVIYNGLDSHEFYDGVKEKHKVPSVMMLYHESVHKGAKEGMVVIDHLKKKYPDMKVNMFGRRKGNDIPDYVNFLENPPRDQLMKMYQSSDIYLFTSQMEAWGLPVMEAMANKCVVIGFNVGAMAEVHTSENSIRIDEIDYGKMEEAVETLIQNPGWIRPMQEAAYQTAGQFEWGTQYKKFEKYLIAMVEIRNEQ